MKRKFIFSLTAIIILIIIILVAGLFLKKEDQNTNLKTIKVSDATLTSWTFIK